jgi:DNA-binding MarR family transcriptional regulator
MKQKNEMTKEAKGHAELALWIRMLKLHNLVFRQARQRLDPYCTMAQFDVLAQLSRSSDGSTPAELSRHLLVTAANITGVVDRMQKAGLVSRTPDPKDRRTIRLHLTEKGKELARSVIPKHSQDIREAFSSLSETELTELRHLLDKLIGGLTKE